MIKFNGSAVKCIGTEYILVGYSDDKIWFKPGIEKDKSYKMDIHEGNMLSGRITINKEVSQNLFDMCDTFYGYYHLLSDEEQSLYYIDLNEPAFLNEARKIKK